MFNNNDQKTVKRTEDEDLEEIQKYSDVSQNTP